MVRGAEIGNHTPIMAGDDDSTSSCRLLWVDAVFDSEPGGLDGVVEDGGVFVVADSTQVDYAVGREHVLRSSGGVLRSTAGN
jgi:hypothetical protein